MSSLLGFLGALGDSLGVGGSSATDPSFLTRLNNNADPAAAAQRLDAQSQQGALQAFANARANGQTSPQQLLNIAAQYDPKYAAQAATLQAQNPLAALLQGNGNNQSAQGSGQGNSGQQSLESLSGDDLIKALPPSIGNQIKAISEGRQAPPSGFAMKSPYGQQIMGLVSQYDPSFDAANPTARAAARKDFTSGKSAQNITALNTAMGHLSSLSDAYDQLGNTDYPLVNTVKNAVGNAFGSKDIQTNTTKVGTDAHAVSEELAKVFRSTGMAESDVKAWENKIGTSTTPAQSKAVINEALDLMNSRLDALGQQYNQGMGTTRNGIELLSPKAQKAYQKISGTTAPQTSASGNLAADNAASASNATQDPIARAKAAGYTQAEIDAYLAKKKGK